MATKTTKKESFKRLIKIFWILMLSPVLLLILALLAANFGLFGKLPETKDLENPKSNLATEVYSDDGALLGKYFLQNRSPVKYEELSPHLTNALVATEDERFYDHSGIDIRSLGRAISYMGKAGGASTITQQLSKMLFSSKPHSTIERLLQKLKEWIIAVRLERQFTKNEIITMYLNRFDFINNAVGIKSASRVYFNKLPSELKIEEASMLVGMAKNPALFNPLPHKRPDTTLHRRNVVFSQMVRNGSLTKSEFDSLKMLPLVLDYRVVDHKEGIAPYFREILREELKTMFAQKDDNDEYVYHKPDGSPYNIYQDGLRVQTTLDSRMQKYAEWAVAQHLKTELQKDFFKDLSRKKNPPFDHKTSKAKADRILNYAMRKSQRYAVLSGKECGNCGRRGKYIKKIEDDGKEFFTCTAQGCEKYKLPVHEEEKIVEIFNTPTQMKVFSWQGDIDTLMSPMDSIRYYKSFLQAGMLSVDPHNGHIKAWVGGINYNHFRYDHVKQSKRQVGSTIKPFVYALAIKYGYSPCYEIPNVDVTIHKGQWNLIKDWTPKTDGKFEGEISLKYALANSMNNATAWIMKQFGPQAVVDFAKQIGIESPLKPVPALCLGVEDISLIEMVGANATFANKGLWLKPSYIKRIEDKNGNVIVDFIPESNEVITEEEAYVMLSLMKGVVDGVYNKYKPKNKTTGTAMRLRLPTSVRPYGGFKTPIAGKTGTTQNHSDGWFMGITPDLVTGVWVGAEDPGVRFRYLSKGMGTNMALPMWGYYMQKVYADSTINISKGDFEKPEKRISIELDCRKANIESGFGEEDDEPNFE